MSAVSYYLESNGIATTGISLIREQTERMRVPRFLWVPFELGRPFGAANNPEFQRRVLRSALALLERTDGPVILEDFPDDAPLAAGEEEVTEPWSCPVFFDSPADSAPELVTETLKEMALLAPWHEVYVGRQAAATPTCSVDTEQVVRSLGELSDGVPDLAAVSSEPTAQWLRLGCDDMRTWYFEAAQGQPGHASHNDLYQWFWRDTAAARLIGSAANALLRHPNQQLVQLALGALVPRSYKPVLMPDASPDH